jgi:hypothetical protein
MEKKEKTGLSLSRPKRLARLLAEDRRICAQTFVWAYTRQSENWRQLVTLHILRLENSFSQLDHDS